MQYQDVDILLLKLPHFVDNSVNLQYATPDSACIDVCAAIDTPLTIEPGGHRAKVPLGIKLAAPKTIWYRLCSRSGLAVNHGVIAIGGIIDNDYRGELFAIMLNTDPKHPYTINPGDKIAQIEIPYPYRANFVPVTQDVYDKLTTVRSDGGFGSTGK